MTKIDQVRVSFIYICVIICIVSFAIGMKYVAAVSLVLAFLVVLIEAIRVVWTHENTIGD